MQNNQKNTDFAAAQNMDVKQLLVQAENAMQNAYAPYSQFKVGAAVLTDQGEIFTGCNIENASYGATNCAERTAIFKAVSEGAKQVNAVAICASSGEATPPCGICRQVMTEFMKPEALIILGVKGKEPVIYQLRELQPMGFRL